MSRWLWIWNLARIGVIVFLDLLGDSSTTQKSLVIFTRFLSSIVLLLRELFFHGCVSLEVLAGSEVVSSEIRRWSRSWTAHVSTFMNVLLVAFLLIYLLKDRLLSPSLLHRNILRLMVIIIDSIPARLVNRVHSVGAEHPFLQRNVLPVLILLRIRIYNLKDIVLNILLQVLFRTHVPILLHLRGANRSTWRAYSHCIQALATDTSNKAIGSLLTHGYAPNSRMNTILASAGATSLWLTLSILLHNKVVIHMVKYLSFLTILGPDFVINRDWWNSIIWIFSVHFENIVGVVLIVAIDINHSTWRNGALRGVLTSFCCRERLTWNDSTRSVDDATCYGSLGLSSCITNELDRLISPSFLILVLIHNIWLLNI